MITDTTVLTPSGQPGGLLAVAREFPEGLDWQRGVSFTSGQCLVTERTGPCPTLGSPGDPVYQTISGETFQPISLRLAVACTTRARAGLGGFASESMRITSEAAIAAELQDGLASETNPKLEDATVAFTAATPLEAVACLEAYGAEILQGKQIWLHVPPQVAVHLTDRVYRDGIYWRTLFGSIVVMSPGYVGQTIYATGDVFAAVGQSEPLEATDRSINRQEAWGDGVGLVAFDPCFLASADTGLDPCEIG